MSYVSRKNDKFEVKWKIKESVSKRSREAPIRPPRVEEIRSARVKTNVLLLVVEVVIAPSHSVK